MASFQIENLTFKYPTREVAALCDLSLEIRDGEFFAVCGKSGSGKSTLLRLLKPTLAPHGALSGKIRIDGTPLSELDFRSQSQKIGFVLQNPDSQIVTDKVWHELAFGLENLGLPREEIRARVAEMASFFGIQDWFHKSVTELSGGQKQLLNLASVMAMQPDVLILDEPTSQLDPIAASDFLTTVQKVNLELGTTVIISEHRLEDVFPICDRALVMEGGRISAIGTPRDVGKMLIQTSSDMSLAMPTPVRIHSAVSNTLPCPLTVREGKTWLNDITSEKELLASAVPTSHEERGDVSAIELCGIYFRYEKDANDVLNGLSLRISAGEIHAIVGGNGAGKSTALALTCGSLRPQRGSVKLFGKDISKIPSSERYNGLIAMLPQSPDALFTADTVYDDLISMPQIESLSENERDLKIKALSDLCQISHLLHSHPRDLSGGEIQRAALVKVMLTNPKILLLDEPTKGLDAHFKETFAKILKELTADGVTVVMVSHDIEFCAKHAHRVSMFFNGTVSGTASARRFFTQKSFYTTAANRMARHKIPNAVTAEDVILVLGGKVPEFPDVPVPRTFKKTPVAQKKKKKPSLRLFGAGAFFLTSLALCFFFYNELQSDGHYLLKLLEIFSVCAFFACLFPKRTYKQKHNVAHTASKFSLLALVITMLVAIIAVYFGLRCFGQRKYYIISILLIFLAFIPLFISFEKRRPSARELALIAILCALAVASRAVFFMIPQFKPLGAVVILAGATLGCESGFLIGALSAFASNIFFGQGPWTPWQMLAFAIIGFLAGIFFNRSALPKSKISFAIFGAVTTFAIYGGIMNAASVLIWQPNPTREMFFLSYARGIPFDLLHAASSAVFLLLLSESICEKLERIKAKYGFMINEHKITGGHE